MKGDKEMNRRKLLKAGGAGVALASSGLLSAPAVWGQGKTGTIKLASINSLSGGFARYGQELEKGITVALEQINGKGLEIGGTRYTIQHQLYDDKSDASTAAKLVEKAVTSDGCTMILASLGSVIVKSCIAVAQRLQFPMMTHWAQIDGVFATQKGNPFLYGAMPPFSRYYTLITQMATKFDNPKIVKAAMITPKDELGVFTAQDYFPSDLKGTNIQLAGVEFFPPKTQEYGPALERIRRLEPEMFVINCYTPDILGVFKEMQAINYFPPMIVVEAPTSLRQGIGDAINGVFAPTFWDPTLDKTKDSYIGTSRDFARLYKAKHGQDVPDFVAACGANNLVIYSEVMKAAGSIDDAKKIGAAFRAYNSETFFSKVKFGDDGLNREGPVYPSQFQEGGGEPKLVYPPEIATAKPIHPYPGFKKV
jgi:branched-chain amino acid transport system substrate-binding protein